MAKIKNVVAMIADLAPGALAVIGGMAMIVGGATGTLWY